MVSPFVIAALAAAAVFYTRSLWIAGFLAAVPLLPGFKRIRGLFLCWGLPALYLGLCTGFLALQGMDAPAPGLPTDSIAALKGTLLDDPRSFSGMSRSPGQERGMAYVKLEETEALLPGTGGVRSSARGRLPVFFPPGTMDRLRDFGRGAKLYVEGRFLADPSGSGEVPFNARSVHIARAAPPLEILRTTLRLAILRRMGEKPWGGLAAALLLGSRENLEGDLARAYRDAGLSHILALSGMHLAFLSALLALALKRPLGKRGALGAGLGFILLYVLLVGPQPSLVRAAIMYVMGTCLVLSGTVRQPLAMLGAAFLIQLLADPPSALGISFILSYLALGGILILSGPLETLFRGPLPSPAASGVAASLGAFIATAPAVAAFFTLLRPVGIAAGFIAVPLSSGFMALAIPAALDLPLAGPPLDRILSLWQGVLKTAISFFSQAPALKATLPVLWVFSATACAGIVFFAHRLTRRRAYLAPFA
ncbi:MAG: ComEC/Rec2 family competence protein [Spirochaetaceae bacterium]|jgi:competence protein ComEC|nr:ComEC/Rec2 family competence protein [Spirochaetaceae bacterium]